MAAPTRTNRGTASLAYASQTTNTITSASFTPAANALLCVQFYEFTNDTTPSLVVTNTHAGTGTWTYVNISDNDTTNWYVARFAYAKAGASPGAGTVTCTRRAGTFSAGMAAEFIEVAGYNTTTPVRQSITAVSTGASQTLTYASACLTASLSFTGATVDDAAAPTTPTGYTARNSFPLPAAAVYGNSAEDLVSPATTIAWTGLGSYHAALYGVEVAASVGGVTKTQAVTATSTAAPVMARRPGKIITAAGTATGATIRSARKAVAASSTGAATAVRAAWKAFGAASVAAPVVSSTRRVLLTFTVASVATATAVRQIAKPITVASTATGTFVRRARKTFTAAATGTPIVASTKVLFQTLTVASVAAVTFVRQVTKPIAVIATGTAAQARQVAKVIVAASAAAVASARRVTKAITASTAGTVIVTSTKVLFQTLTAAAATTVSTVRAVGKQITGTSTVVAAIANRVSKTLALVSNAAAAVATFITRAGGTTFFQTLTVSSTVAVSFLKRVGKFVTGSGAGTGTVTADVTSVAPWVFSPPLIQAGSSSLPDRSRIREGVSRQANRLAGHYRRQVPLSVLKLGVVYIETLEPTQEETDAASEVYLGGRDYTVTPQVAAALIAAGYRVVQRSM